MNISLHFCIYLFCVIRPWTKLHITVLLVKGEPESEEEMKKVPPLKLSQEKLVERRGRALKSAPRQKCHKYVWFLKMRKCANIFVGTIQRRFGRRTCRWRAGSMSPHLSVKLINLYFASHILTFFFYLASTSNAFQVLSFFFSFLNFLACLVLAPP